MRYSMTVACWLYYDNQDGPIFTYWTRGKYGVVIRIHNGKFFAHFRNRNHSQTTPLQSSTLRHGWTFVGASYNRSSGEAKLWVDGVEKRKRSIGTNFDLGTQDNITMGVRRHSDSYFKGRITQMQVYKLALTQEQIKAVKEQINRTGRNVSFFIQITKRDKKRLTWRINTMCIVTFLIGWM